MSVKSFASKAQSEVSKRSGWDNSSRIDAVSVAADEKVAKMVADQVLANYPHLKAVHSN